MKIQICSDLHLEIRNNREWLHSHTLIPKGDILILAGDTYYLDRNFQDLDFIQRVSDEFQAVYLIPGNHEYYGGYDISTALEPSYQKVKDNVFMVNNTSIVVGGVQVIFSTLWSEIRNNILEIMRGMMDFRRIRYKGEKFTVNHFNEIHEASFDFLRKTVAGSENGRKVVVTHHLPSDSCNSKEFIGSALNEAFCVDKTNFIMDSDIDFWIYGHSHRNMKDFKIGGTEMITNQLGYVDLFEQGGFDYEKVIEVI